MDALDFIILMCCDFWTHTGNGIFRRCQFLGTFGNWWRILNECSLYQRDNGYMCDIQWIFLWYVPGIGGTSVMFGYWSIVDVGVVVVFTLNFLPNGIRSTPSVRPDSAC